MIYKSTQEAHITFAVHINDTIDLRQPLVRVIVEHG